MKTGFGVKKRLILLAVMSIMVLLSKAQSNLVFYNSNDQFVSPGFNPSFLHNEGKFTFSIFPFSGMSVGYNNQEVVKGMLLNFVSGNVTKDKMTEVFKSLLSQDLFTQRFETPLLSFGYNSEIGSFSFRINEIEQIRTGLKGDFTAFINDSTFQTIALNQPQNLYANAVHYREYSLGYAREIIANKLWIGLRAKLYFGKASLSTQVPGQVTGENGNYYLETNGPINTSLPVDFKVDNDSIIREMTASANFTPVNYLFNRKNLGAGVDFGLNFKINSNIALSASVVDFGKINWDSNLNRLNLRGKFEIPSKYIVDSGDNFITKDPSFSTDDRDLTDLYKCFIDTSDFSTRMPTSLYAGIQYRIYPKLNIGMVERYITSKGLSQNSISLTANYEVNTKLTVISGYSTIGKSNNVPIALIYNWNSGQSFLGTDNLMAFLRPSHADYAAITFGTSFYLFKPKVRISRQAEYMPFYKKKKRNIFNN